GLGQKESDEAKLASQRLPIFVNVETLAEAMGISVGELRFLAFSRRVSTCTHYRRFALKKKSGGLRNISAPMPRLKRAQEWIRLEILDRVELHRDAHGFRPGRSIVSNAKPHVGSDVVINVDLEDFFPTVTFRRIRGVFRSLGYSEQIATILALICSEPDVDEVSLDGTTYFVAKSERYLPQGAPSSPAITNIICRGLDARLSYAAEKLGFKYTRYADDITFSGSGDALRNVGCVLRRVKHVVEDEDFKLHPKKTRVLRGSRRQEVTGLVVNERVNIPRRTLRRFRAVLFQIERDGPAGKHWGDSADVIESIEGFANFVAMVDAEKGTEFQKRVRAIVDRYGKRRPPRAQRPRWKPRAPEPKVTAENESAAQKPEAKKKKPWWKFW
ncbi:MAG: reverse transcriptase family protein, partial [Planctomycetota bacterium]